MYSVGFYSESNLIVILFNLLYFIFNLGFDCKGCVIERERERERERVCVKTQVIEVRRFLAGSSRLSIPQSEACALRMTGMRRVNTDGDSYVSQVFRG